MNGPRRRIPSHVVGFDDGSFARSHRGDVLLVGAVFSGLRLEGVLSARVRRDGVNSTSRIVEVVRASRFRPHLQALLLQGIAFGGFNVVDLDGLHRALGLPVLVVCRRKPDLELIRSALLRRVPGGARKWRLIQRAGPMEAMGPLYVQRRGIDLADAAALLERLAVHSALPEPLRTAHLIAAGVTAGESRQRA